MFVEWSFVSAALHPDYRGDVTFPLVGSYLGPMNVSRKRTPREAAWWCAVEVDQQCGLSLRRGETLWTFVREEVKDYAIGLEHHLKAGEPAGTMPHLAIWRDQALMAVIRPGPDGAPEVVKL